MVTAGAEAGGGDDGPQLAPPEPPTDDPILVKRAKWASMAKIGKSLGYGLLLIAIVAFVAGFTTNFPAGTVTLSITGLIGACVVLPPAIIAGYAVKSAEREDRRNGLL